MDGIQLPPTVMHGWLNRCTEIKRDQGPADTLSIFKLLPNVQRV